MAVRVNPAMKKTAGTGEMYQRPAASDTTAAAAAPTGGIVVASEAVLRDAAAPWRGRNTHPAAPAEMIAAIGPKKIAKIRRLPRLGSFRLHRHPFRS